MLYRFENRKRPVTASRINNGLSPLPHIHPHLELIYLSQGSATATVDNNNYLLDSGELFVAFPNQIHCYHNRIPGKGHMIIFSPDIFPDMKELFQTMIPVNPVISASLLPADIDARLAKICEFFCSEATYERIAAKGYLLALLAEVLPKVEMVSQTTDLDNTQKLLIYCMENYTEPITLDSVSKALHLNKYYISHIFKERMDIGFSDFISSLRLEHACALLEKDCSITEVAYASGFSSIRTFNRLFARKLGATPTEYMKQKRAIR